MKETRKLDDPNGLDDIVLKEMLDFLRELTFHPSEVAERQVVDADKRSQQDDGYST